MNFTNTNNSILHPSSRSINWTASSTASSRVGDEKYATAQIPYSVIHRDSPTVPLFPSLTPSPSSSSSNSNPSIITGTCGRQVSNQRLFSSRSSFNLGAFNVRTLRQLGQQAALATTLDKMNISVCCVSETKIYDTSRILLTSPAVSEKFWLRCSGDPTAAALGQAGVGIVLNSKAEGSLLEWIPINSRVCAVRLEGNTKANASRSKKRCLFIISAYSPTNASDDPAEEEFLSQLRSLIRRAKSTDIVVLAGDMNAQVGQLEESESSLGGRYSLGHTRSNNGDRLLQLCAEEHLFLASTHFRCGVRQLSTWRSPDSKHWTQIDLIAIS